MRIITTILLTLVVFSHACGTGALPLWDRQPKDVAYLRSVGFEFNVDRAMAHHYAKSVAEITITFPSNFPDRNRARSFDSVSILSEDISTGIEVYPEAAKRRIRLTISHGLLRRSQLAFYFAGPAEGASKGAMYILDLSAVVPGKQTDTSTGRTKQRPRK